jgi:hypothetical protein
VWSLGITVNFPPLLLASREKEFTSTIFKRCENMADARAQVNPAAAWGSMILGAARITSIFLFAFY